MSLTGKIANTLSLRLDPFTRAVSRFHARLYRRTGGRFLRSWMGTPMMLLTVHGRKSGKLRTVPLMFARYGDDYLVCGSYGGNPDPPSWFLNLREAGEGDAQVGKDRFHVTARVADDGERAELWSVLCAAYKDFADYQTRTDRELPVVVLSPS